MRSFFFGCSNTSAGHYFFLPGMSKAKDSDVGPWPNTKAWHNDPTPIVPWGYAVERLVGSYDKQGRAYLHHLDGWTALAFCDRTVDSRPGSKSVYVFDQDLDFATALRFAQEIFPSVFARYPFEVVEAVYED